MLPLIRSKTVLVSFTGNSRYSVLSPSSHLILSIMQPGCILDGLFSFKDSCVNDLDKLVECLVGSVLDFPKVPPYINKTHLEHFIMISKWLTKSEFEYRLGFLAVYWSTNFLVSLNEGVCSSFE